MQIIEYSYKDVEGWNFAPVKLRKINLFVGPSGSGKTRILNTIFNIGSFIATNANPRNGHWNIKFKNGDNYYRWEFEGVQTGADYHVEKEILDQLDENDTVTNIYKRDKSSFTFRGSPLPKLPKDSTGLFLLKEEELVDLAYSGFKKICRRNFFGNELENATSRMVMPDSLMVKNNNWKINWQTMNPNLSLNLRLFILNDSFKKIYDSIVEEFRAVFPNVINFQFTDGSKIHNSLNEGKMPLVLITEKNVSEPYYLDDMSSGMQKVLLIITDILSLPDESVYIMDEYENSLGINAINFLPSFLTTFGRKIQFLITSHHPYLINNIPVSDWSMFYREGSTVKIKTGEELVKKYGVSKQTAFTQLINDPEYLGL